MNAAVRPSFRFESWFYVAIAAVVVAVTLAGFSIDVDLLRDMSSLSTLVRVHGTIMFLWIAIFAIQVGLVAARRTSWHRRVGVFGACLAAALVISGVAVSLSAVRLGGDHLPPGVPGNLFLALAFQILILFCLFTTAGILWRRRPDWHKRLMLLATLPLLDAALIRFIGTYTTWEIDSSTIRNAILFSCIAVDTIRHRRLHPVFVAGAIVMVTTDYLAPMAASTTAWIHFTAWVAGNP